MRRLCLVLLAVLLCAVATGALAGPAHPSAHKNPPVDTNPGTTKVPPHIGCRKFLRVGNHGKCVRSAQWLATGASPAVRPKIRYWHVRKIAPSGVFRANFRGSTRLLKWRLGYPKAEIDGVFGPLLRAYILGKAVPLRAWRLRAGARQKAWEFDRRHPKVPPVDSKMRLLNKYAYETILFNSQNGYRYWYTQGWHRDDFRNGYQNFPEGGDCSASIRALYHLADLPEIGTWTGDQQRYGRIVWRIGQSISLIRPGDRVYYGYSSGFSHVAMALGDSTGHFNGRVYTFGNGACPCNYPVLYRSDARIARRGW